MGLLISQINTSDWLEKNPPTGERLWGPDSDDEAAGEKEKK